MVDPVFILFAVVVALPVCVILVAIIGLVYFIGRWWLKSTRAAVRQLEERFGFVNHNPTGIYPDLRGKVEGVDVVVDVQYERYTPMGSPGRTTIRPWARVRAWLPVTPQVQVRSRHQKYGEEIEWPARQTGDPAFDKKYELFMPEDAALDVALPAAVREALLAANPPVHIKNDVALWTRLRMVHDAELLKNAILSCSRVAAAYANTRAVPYEPT